MVNDVPETDDFLSLNPVSSLCCGLWSPHIHSFPYSLQVTEQSWYCVCNVAVALLLVKYIRISSIIGYGVQLYNLARYTSRHRSDPQVSWIYLSARFIILWCAGCSDYITTFVELTITIV
jgi:hypothetical protein